ncbi:MAG TPA: transposase [Armatimonadota bacterium]|jgi:putative transposase
MPRLARVVLAGFPHHLLQMGNNRQPVFYSDTDRQTYLALLREYAERDGLEILAYCLMPNHVHLIAVPATAPALAHAVGGTHMRYTQYLNGYKGWTGHIWQGRFYSCVLDEVFLWTALRYVERNPVRAGLVTQPWEFPWSSAAAHTGKADPSGLLDLEAWARRCTPEAWRAQLGYADDRADAEIMRAHTQVGRPLGRSDFIDELENTLGHCLRPQPVGRPRKTPEPTTTP